MATIRKRSEKWQVQVRRKGAVPVTRSFLLKSDAQRWARQMEDKADRLGLTYDPRELDDTTLGDLVQRYRQAVTPGKKSAKNEDIFLKRLLRNAVTGRRLSELSPSLFAAYRDERLKVVRPSSVLRELATIQNIIEVARREWGIPFAANPVASIKKPPPSKARARRLEPGERQLIQNALRDVRNPILGPLFRFAVATGMRRGELLEMEWRHVDRERQLLLIPRTKNGHSRTIPLSTAALTALSDVHNLNPVRVFPTTANAVRLAWARLRRKAGIPDLRFHDLRHEAVSSFFERGLSMPEVALISGHRDPRMLMRYTHLRPEELVSKLG